jgi:hypothetical protein
MANCNRMDLKELEFLVLYSSSGNNNNNNSNSNSSNNNSNRSIKFKLARGKGLSDNAFVETLQYKRNRSETGTSKVHLDANVLNFVSTIL